MSILPAWRAAAVLCLSLLTGCLEVESMEMQVVADRANDRLDVMLTSRGVWSSATNETNLAKDLADLRKCRELSAVPLPGIGVVDLSQPAEGQDGKWLQLVPFLDIEPGAFFVDEQGRLSFYQFLRIHRPKQFAAVVDEIARASWATQKQRGSPETIALMEQAGREQWPLFVVDGAGFTLRRPLADADHRAEQAQLWNEVARKVERAVTGEGGAEKSDATQRGPIQMLRDNDVAIVRRAGVTEYVIGTQGSEVCDYQLRGGKYQDNLMQAFGETEPPPPAVTQALIDKQFASFRQREARVPPAFREQKQRAVPRDK